ncbi:unnamed protein product [Meganyctiphanes norvegica]|uniref:Uncharacterized protein n=1 Tax=Meganyctiphanes norvegica TaxID=48144 RepID=A0AAV2R1S9_MEGNR
MDARKCSHLTILLLILLDVSLVAVCASNPFNRWDNPFNNGNNPFNRGDNPFNNGDNPFNRGDNPFNNGDNPFNRGNNPFNNGDNPFNRGNNPFNNGDNPFNRADHPFNNGDNPFNRGENPFNNGDNPFNHGDNPFNNGDNPFNRGYNSFNNGDNPFNRGDNPFNNGDNPFNRGDNPFNNGDNPFNRGDNPFNNGDNPFNRGDNPFNNGDNPFNREDNPLNKEDNPYNSGDNPFNNKKTLNYLCCINNKETIKGWDLIQFGFDLLTNFCPSKAIQLADFAGTQKYIIYNVSKEEYNTCRSNQAPSDIVSACELPFDPEAGCQAPKPEQDDYYKLKAIKGDQYRVDGCFSIQRIKVSSHTSHEEVHGALMTKLGISGSSHVEVGVFMFAIALVVGLM